MVTEWGMYEYDDLPTTAARLKRSITRTKLKCAGSRLQQSILE